MFGVPAAERPSVFGVPAAERPPAPAPAPDRRRAAQLMATPWGMVKCVGGGQAAGADPFRTWTLYRSTRSTPIEVVDVAGGSRQDWAVVRAVLQAAPFPLPTLPGPGKASVQWRVYPVCARKATSFPEVDLTMGGPPRTFDLDLALVDACVPRRDVVDPDDTSRYASALLACMLFWFHVMKDKAGTQWTVAMLAALNTGQLTASRFQFEAGEVHVWVLPLT